MMEITVTVEHNGETTSHTLNVPPGTGLEQELAVIQDSVRIDGRLPSLARILTSMILPGLNVAIKTYADKRYKQRIAELRDYLR